MYIFFFNDPATTEIYTLSLHDALPILPERKSGTKRWKSWSEPPSAASPVSDTPSTLCCDSLRWRPWGIDLDRKSTRLNSSHANISYAVFCLKKKTNDHTPSLPISPFQS